MEKISEVIVVEGRDDIIRLQQVVEADFLETKGSALGAEFFHLLEHVLETREVIVFTDPDHSGEKIRQAITARFPQVKHAFLSKKEAQPKKQGSLGVEHASDEALLAALHAVATPCRRRYGEVSRTFLQQFGLWSGPGAKQRRAYLGEQLRLGYTNGKQLQKRLALFGITEEQIAATMAQYKEEN